MNIRAIIRLNSYPVTGDSFNPTMWIVIAAIAFVSLLFVVFLALKDRKQQTDED